MNDVLTAPVVAPEPDTVNPADCISVYEPFRALAYLTLNITLGDVPDAPVPTDVHII